MSEEERGEVSFSEELSGATKEVVLGGLSGLTVFFRRNVIWISFLPIWMFLMWVAGRGVGLSFLLALAVCGLVFPVLVRTRYWWVALLTIVWLLYLTLSKFIHWPIGRAFINWLSRSLSIGSGGTGGVAPTPTTRPLGFE